MYTYIICAVSGVVIGIFIGMAIDKTIQLNKLVEVYNAF